MKRVYSLTPFGKEIKKILIDLEMSQAELARKMGVTSVYVGEILRGTRGSQAAQERICEALELNYTEILENIQKGA